jgi:subtilisin inhibitor-like
MRYRTLLFTLPGIAVILGLSSCGSEQATSTPSRTSPEVASPAPAEPATKLTIAVKASAQAPAKTWALTCGPVGGTHPDAAAACATLDKVTVDDPFKPVPKHQMCTMIFGGPEEATVTGTWKGKPVNAKFNRKNGCEMSRWSNLAALFGPVPPAR